MNRGRRYNGQNHKVAAIMHYDDLSTRVWGTGPTERTARLDFLRQTRAEPHAYLPISPLACEFLARGGDRTVLIVENGRVVTPTKKSA